MAGTLSPSELTMNDVSSDRAKFSLATPADDAEIRRLLRENSMPGRITVALEREPDYFAQDRRQVGEHQTIIVRQGARAIGFGTCSVRSRFVNGRPQRVGYLSGLRLDAQVAGRFDLLRRGYKLFRELRRPDGPGHYFTSIAADNHRALQFLERGLPGMPAYEFVSEFVTLLVRVPRRGFRGPNSRTPVSDRNFQANECSASAEELAAFLNEHNRQYQFTACWTADELTALRPLGLRLEDSRVIRDGARVIACAALWDQRSFKQVVVRGYAQPLAMLRPLINLSARLTGAPRLPAIGSVLAHAMVSPLAAQADRPELPGLLIEELVSVAGNRGLDFVTLGFAANDPRLAAVRSRFACREYRSRLYSVHWPETAGAAGLDGRLPWPEVSLL
jgi:hypothetical protein